MENNLKLLSLAKDFNVQEVVKHTYYTVEVVGSNLFATIYPEENKIQYFIATDTYLNASESIMINIKDLNKLQQFCELLMEEGE